MVQFFKLLLMLVTAANVGWAAYGFVSGDYAIAALNVFSAAFGALVLLDARA